MDASGPSGHTPGPRRARGWPRLVVATPRGEPRQVGTIAFEIAFTIKRAASLSGRQPTRSWQQASGPPAGLGDGGTGGDGAWQRADFIEERLLPSRTGRRLGIHGDACANASGGIGARAGHAANRRPSQRLRRPLLELRPALLRQLRAAVPLRCQVQVVVQQTLNSAAAVRPKQTAHFDPVSMAHCRAGRPER